MILADTTIVIDYLRTPTARMVKIIQAHQAAICEELNQVLALLDNGADT